MNSEGNRTQYADISMEITTFSFAADDTMAAFTPLPPESKKSGVSNAMAEELKQLRQTISQLEKDKVDLHEKLKSTADEREEYKASADAKSVELRIVHRELAEITKTKENAEKRVANYEFIVEDLKKRLNCRKQQDLYRKVISLEEEIRTCRIANKNLLEEKNKVNDEKLMVEERLQKAIFEKDATEKQLQDENALLRREVIQMKLELEAMRRNHSVEISEIQKVLVESNQKLAEKEASISDLVKKCERFDKSDREYKERIAILQNETELLKTQLAEAKSARLNKNDEALEGKVATLEREILNVKKVLTDWNMKEATSSQGDPREHRTKIEQLLKRLRSLRK
ncbi:unnamed protein product [Cylicocyclus nassatus]|uniref:Uncharacterized protein n=1 Tax=Cylicocyclus nassatus TaxID=53992 RepID=A0AA36HGW1_CYLNA|nr:unnamed protein product [Cylicocyclus nassatus]